MEQYIQTSPVSPFKKRSPSRELNYLSQCTQTTNSEEESSSSERLKRSPHGHGWKKLGKEKIIRKKDVLSIDDLKTLKDRKRQKVDDTGSLAGAGRVLKKRRIPPRSSPVAREHTSLKVRVLSLQQQVMSRFMYLFVFLHLFSLLSDGDIDECILIVCLVPAHSKILVFCRQRRRQT